MYDIIGDVHGCYPELLALLEKIDYKPHTESGYTHPRHRKLVFVGDLTDRGPASLQVIALVTHLVKNKQALYVPGNHCDTLYRWMMGRNVQVKHGLETTVAELKNVSAEERKHTIHAFTKLVQHSSYYLTLDQSKLIVAHAGMKTSLFGRQDKEVRKFCLYGDITGKKDADGFPIRGDWAQHYKGKRWIIYGHTPVLKPRQVNRTINIDTGCVFGGSLTALHYPEFKFESVPSSMPYVPEKFRLDNG